MIDSLVRKPGAFANYRYREEMFPTSQFRIAYDMLSDGSRSRRWPTRNTCKFWSWPLARAKTRWPMHCAPISAAGEPIDVESIRQLVADATESPAGDRRAMSSHRTLLISILYFTTFDKESPMTMTRTDEPSKTSARETPSTANRRTTSSDAA